MNDDALRATLLANIHARLPDLEALLEETGSHWHAEDGFYRFYHQSFKAYGLQSDTLSIVAALRDLLPDRPLNARFSQIISEGTGKKFAMEHKRNEVILDETDGLDWATAVKCDLIHLLPKADFAEKRCEVSLPRRRALARKIIECLRLPY